MTVFRPSEFTALRVAKILLDSWRHSLLARRVWRRIRPYALAILAINLCVGVAGVFFSYWVMQSTGGGAPLAMLPMMILSSVFGCVGLLLALVHYAVPYL